MENRETNKTRKITIGHLYPDLLNLYGDRGNIACLMQRCIWRGIGAETVEFELNDEIGELAINNVGNTNDQMHYSYTGSVSVATKTLTENHGMGMHIVAVQITRSAHA